MSNQDAEKALRRYDLVAHYRCGETAEEMGRNDEDGEWMRHEDMAPALSAALEEGRREEREECAKTCEYAARMAYANGDAHGDFMLRQCAESLRALASAPDGPSPSPEVKP
jgi:hypothetical protein